ncbi:MAG TPA: oligoendopeptidase F [Bacilli bacterium]|nr:oligoendopeptidase F [Bacilli bacterium]
MEKLRNEIDSKFKWNIKSLYNSIEDFEKDVDKVKELNNKLLEFKNKIVLNSNNLLNFYETYLEYNLVEENLYVYSKMLCDQDTKDNNNQAIKMKIEKLMDDLNAKLSFISPEILSVDFEVIEKYIEQEPKLELYRFDLEKTFRYKKHTLSKIEEEIISKANNAMGTGDDAFYNLDNSDIKLDSIIDENGKKVELNNSNFIKYMNSKDRNVRKSAFLSMYKYWEGLKNTVAATYKGQIKEDFFNSEIRKYNSPLEDSLFSDNIDKKVYTNLIETVHKNLDKMYDYVDLRKKVLNVDELHMYDVYVDLCSDVPKNIPFEDGKRIVFDALKPLGERYLSDLEKAFNENWIDIYPNIGKKSGAYSWGTYTSYPYVLLNYNDTVDSVSTMAHELGHSMHTYYTNKKQPYIYSGYPIFLAEIASTTNEILLNDYLIKNAKTNKEKQLYINDFLDKIKGTLYRQTMFAEFEMIIHDKYNDGIALTDEEISNTYYELNKLYFGPNMISDEEIRHEWKRIPHFYSPFYVYKYATGISAAVSIASDILNNVEGAKEKYLELLSSGSSDHPLELLKKAGVDMTTPEPIEKALDMFNEKLEILKTLF